MAIPPPPFPKSGTPTPPLSASERQAMVAWLDTLHSVKPGTYSNLSDDDLEIFYRDGVNSWENQNSQGGLKTIPLGIGPTISTTESVAGFLGKLTQAQTWVRIAEFVGGAILIAAGANALVKSRPKNAVSAGFQSYNAPKAQATKSLAEIAKT